MNPILVLVLLAISILGLTFLGWSFIIWTDGYKDASLRMSFGEFRRIYDLAPSKWDRCYNYVYTRKEWIPTYENWRGVSGRHISTSIAMKTIFDFWRLLFWVKGCKRRSEREMQFMKKKNSLNSLSIMIEKDADDVRKKLEEEEKKAEMLRREIIDELRGKVYGG